MLSSVELPLRKDCNGLLAENTKEYLVCGLRPDSPSRKTDSKAEGSVHREETVRDGGRKKLLCY